MPQVWIQGIGAYRLLHPSVQELRLHIQHRQGDGILSGLVDLAVAFVPRGDLALDLAGKRVSR